MENKYLISDEEKAAYIEVLLKNLPSLRARIGMSQEELASAIGVSRQTYHGIESGKRNMSWPTFLSILFLFDKVRETSNMLRDLNVYPTKLVKKLNGDTEA